TTGQRAEAAEGALLFWAQKSIAPGDRGIHRLLALGKIASAGRREQDIMRESAKQLLSGQHFDPRSRQFERERQRVETPANRCHGLSVRGRETKLWLHVSNPIHEESHRWVPRQIGRRHRVWGLQLERSDDV